MSDATSSAAGLRVAGLERRQLELKVIGPPVTANVLHVLTVR